MFSINDRSFLVLQIVSADNFDAVVVGGGGVAAATVVDGVTREKCMAELTTMCVDDNVIGDGNDDDDVV